MAPRKARRLPPPEKTSSEDTKKPERKSRSGFLRCSGSEVILSELRHAAVALFLREEGRAVRLDQLAGQEDEQIALFGILVTRLEQAPDE